MKMSDTRPRAARENSSARDERDRAGGGGDQDQNPCSVGPALGIDVGMKETRNRECDSHEDEHQRARGASPLGSHAEAGKIAGDKVEQAGHGGGSGKGKNEDGAQVINSAESRFQGSGGPGKP